MAERWYNSTMALYLGIAAIVLAGGYVYNMPSAKEKLAIEKVQLERTMVEHGLTNKLENVENK